MHVVYSKIAFIHNRLYTQPFATPLCDISFSFWFRTSSTNHCFLPVLTLSPLKRHVSYQLSMFFVFSIFGHSLVLYYVSLYPASERSFCTCFFVSETSLSMLSLISCILQPPPSRSKFYDFIFI